ncbi:hypothetical protein E2P81_ATG01128 [Venturia nashicola]|nr:hypothetical protein E2P81_ATG01128 [Venturia nashicola]
MTMPASATTDLSNSSNTTTPGHENGKRMNHTTLFAVIAVLAIVVALAGVAAFSALRRHKRKSRRQKEYEHAKDQSTANHYFWDRRIRDARNQGIEFKSLQAGGRPVISGPFALRREDIPKEWIEKRNALEAEKQMRSPHPTFDAGRERRFSEAGRAEQVAGFEARKMTMPVAVHTRAPYQGPAGMPREDSAVDGRFTVGNHGDESDDETMVEAGKVYRVDNKYRTEAGQGPASMPYSTAGLSREASQREVGWSGVPQRDAGPALNSKETGGNVEEKSGASSDHFGGANPYKQKNESAWSEESRERKRDKLAQGAKNLGSGIKSAFGRKDSKKEKKEGKKG